jgi:hypothetical protein
LIKQNLSICQLLIWQVVPAVSSRIVQLMSEVFSNVRLLSLSLAYGLGLFC